MADGLQRTGTARLAVQASYSVGAVLCAFLLRWLLVRSLGPDFPRYTLFYPAVLVAALAGGLGAGALATASAALLAVVAWLRPVTDLERWQPDEIVGLILFVVVCLLMSAAAEWHRRTRREAAELEKQLAVQQVRDARRETEARLRDEAAASLRREKEALLEADQHRTRFLAVLSHELRNPLAPIRFALDLLARDPAPAAQLRGRTVIERQLNHLVRLVDDLLDLTRLTSQKLNLRRQVVGVECIIHDAVEAALPNIEAAGHDFVVPAIPANLWIDADPHRVAQAVTNLLNNAAKFTPRGGRVDLVVDGTGSDVFIRVADTGVGLSERDRARVFEMFTQVDGTQGGLGIGLALVKAIVELHGGTVEVKSGGANAGSELTIGLPRVQPAENVEMTNVDLNRTRPRRILVVDDNVDAADMMQTLLELDGHDVRVAHDGEGALALAAEFQPEIGLFDLGLPGMDGNELARRIRDTPGGARVFLVAVTGWGQEEDRARSREHGFNAHLTKPAEPEAIRRLIAGVPSTLAG